MLAKIRLSKDIPQWSGQEAVSTAHTIRIAVRVSKAKNESLLGRPQAYELVLRAIVGVHT